MPNSSIDTKIIRSVSYNPWFNLAIEEFLFDRILANQVILYLWQNENTIVLGKNQNAWKECDWKLLESDGGKLARRLSGGGTVFHDLGNLNYTFIMSRDLYDLDTQMKVILIALENLGIKGEYTGRNDLTFQGKKFSGNAFYFKDNTAYHHGTLLINTDLVKLTRYLQVSKEKIQSKGIDSVRSRVVNLSELKNDLSVECVIDSLKNSFQRIYGGNPEEIGSEIYADQITELFEKYSSWQWRFGESPKFDMSFQKRFLWGDIEIGFVLKNGIIISSIFYSDAMDSTLIQKIALSMQGVPFSLRDITACLHNINTSIEGERNINDLINWLKTKL